MTPLGLTVVIPAFREARAIRETLERVVRDLPPALAGWEVVVVDDGSDDGTAEAVLAAAAAEPRIRCVRHDRNAGKGKAFRTGVAEARYARVLLLDADGQVGAEALRGIEGADGVVVGHRLGRRDGPIRTLVTLAYRVAARALLGIRVRDVNCPFKLLPRELVRGLPLRADGFLLDAELLYRVARRGIAVREVGVACRPRAHGRSTVRFRHLPQLVRELVILLRERDPAAVAPGGPDRGPGGASA